MSTFDRLAGSVIDDKYRVAQRLGTGGMGAVFLATHLGTDRPVALKLIAPRFAADATFIERFRREARAAGRLRHPNIVDVTDFGFADVGGERLAYLVMEYLDGCSLADVLEEDHTLPLDWVVDFFNQLALAVDEAHRLGVVHRDLKPSNVWLEPNRRGGFTVKVLDFGLAKVADLAPAPLPAAPPPAAPLPTTALPPAPPALGENPGAAAAERARSGAATLPAPLAAADAYGETLPYPEPDDAAPPSDHGASQPLWDSTVLQAAGARQTLAPRATELTRAGTVMGTPPYMSPEQCRGEAAGPASDVYSLGVIVYEMLAGSTPFQGSTAALLRKHTSEEPEALARRAPAVPGRVSDVVMSALAKDPAARPASAALFAAAMRAKAESWRGLFGRAAARCTAHYPLFFRISFVACLPFLLVHALDDANESLGRLGAVSELATDLAGLPLLVLSVVTGFLASVMSRGVAALVLAQLLVAPLRKPRVRLAATVLRRHLRRIAGGALLTSAVVFGLLIASFAAALGAYELGDMAFGDGAHSPAGTAAAGAGCAAAALAAAALLWLALRKWIDYQLFPIVLLVEGRSVRDGMARSRNLSRRSRREVTAVAAASLAPLAVSSVFTATLYKLFDMPADTAAARIVDFVGSAPIVLFADPFVSVLSGLLYLKLRQIDGEPVEEALDCQFIDEEPPRSRWQRRLSSGAHAATPRGRSAGEPGA